MITTSHLLSYGNNNHNARFKISVRRHAYQLILWVCFCKIKNLSVTPTRDYIKYLRKVKKEQSEQK